MKNTIKLKTKNLLGINSLESHLKDLKAINIIGNLRFDGSLSDEWLLSCFPSIRGGIKATNRTDNLRAYLQLIRPLKWGGATKVWRSK